MIKKKILILFLILLLPTNSFAITLGSSLGFNFGKLTLKTKENNFFNNLKTDYNLDIGFFYKYNWNLKKFFIGVEFFYDFLNLKNFIDTSSINIRYRYGSNLNFGYDITEKFSLYGLIGYGLIKYKAKNKSVEFFDKDNSFKFNSLYGFGVSYDLSIQWKINFEYNIQSLNVELTDKNNKLYNLKNNIQSLKFSIIYKF